LVVSLLFIAYARSDNSNEMCCLKGKKNEKRAEIAKFICLRFDDIRTTDREREMNSRSTLLRKIRANTNLYSQLDLAI